MKEEGRVDVVHMTSVHPLDDIRIFRKECVTLAQAGERVALIGPSTSGGQVADGVLIVTVAPTRGRLRRMLFAPLRCALAALQLKATLVHFHDPELIPVALALKVRGRKVVYDVHEDLPKDILTKEWIPKYLRRLIAILASLMEAVVARAVDHLVVTTPAIAQRFPREKTTVIQNFPILEEFAAPGSSRLSDTIIYAGAIERIRGAVEMVDAMAYLPPGGQAKLSLAGDCSEELQTRLMSSAGWARTELLGRVSRGDLMDLLARATVGLVLFHAVPNHTEAQPNKLFEYMAAGLPIVCSAFPLWRALVSEVGCGICVDPNSPEEIAAAIQELIGDPAMRAEMGKRGREAVVGRYNWDAESQRLLHLYSVLCGRPIGPIS
jgi:glycosyltransferase involved in cell wall biosynthesis